MTKAGRPKGARNKVDTKPAGVAASRVSYTRKDDLGNRIIHGNKHRGNCVWDEKTGKPI